MFKGANWFFTLVLIFALGYFIFIYVRKKQYLPQISLICAGIIGNLTDRLTLGYVVDFINFHVWPVFNVADSSICIGIIWLIISSIRNKDELF